MRLLLMHPNFPAQFRHVAGALGREPGNKIIFATKNKRPEWEIQGVTKAVYVPQDVSANGINRLAAPFEEAVRQGEAAYKLLKDLKAKGFRPDLIYGHSGWGNTLYVKDVFPEAPLLCYFEWFYDPLGADANFDPPKRTKRPQDRPPALIRTRNAPILSDLWTCDHGICPTGWQRSQFPDMFRHKLTVVHDGIDTDYFTPDENARLDFAGLDLPAGSEIVTYTARGMEPYRGFPQFMEAAHKVLAKRKNCHVVVAGSERVCYGTPPADGKSWKQIMLEKLSFDKNRLHFVGSLPYGQYKRLLQCSSVHIYLTRPFVLSWSSVEAMACGCAMVVSDTPPVREAFTHGENGMYADFYSADEIAARIMQVLEDKPLAAKLRANARRTAVERYSLKKLLPKHLEIMRDTARGRYSR